MITTKQESVSSSIAAMLRQKQSSDNRELLDLASDTFEKQQEQIETLNERQW